ncbi:MAG: hypothetical protein WAV11_03235 [Minisyncoccia bacterium]
MDDLKWILLAVVIMFFVSRFFDFATPTSASVPKNTVNLLPSAKNQIITTKVLDRYGNVVELKESQY